MTLRDRIDDLRRTADALESVHGKLAPSGGVASAARLRAAIDAMTLTDAELAGHDLMTLAAGALLGQEDAERVSAILDEAKRRAALSAHQRLAEEAERMELRR